MTWVLLLILLTACAKPRPNVILLSIDTLRADRVGKGLTPNLDAFARDAIRYDAWSHCPLTLPSHTSILTGLLPPEHGVRDNAGYRFDARRHPSMPAILRANGYRTGAAVSAFVLRGDSGLREGFDEYDDAIGAVEGAPTGAVQRLGRVTTNVARDWIAKQSGGQPWFYFLHLFEPHSPHARSYDDDVREADAIAGEFLQFLKARDLYDDTLIVILSDHGEGLGDHGEEEHGVFLYREALEVPLLVKLPGGKRAGTTGGEAQLVDVLPTILDAARLPRVEGLRGASLLNEPQDRVSYAESLYPRLHLGWNDLQSVKRGSMHYIEAPRAELYDLERDPQERRNAIAENRRVLHELRETLASFGATFTAPAAITPEEARKLAALGYVSAGAEERSGIDPKDRIADLARLKEIGALRSGGDAEGAIAAMEQLLAANPKWSDVRDELGFALAERGDHERAWRVFEEGIAAAPKLAAAFALNAATELIELDRLGEAEKRARFALDAGVAEAHLALGEIALARGDLSLALAEADAAGRSASLAANARFLEARVAIARRDLPAAVGLLSKTQREQQRLGGSLPRRFHYVAGDVLARLGKMNEARMAFEAEIARDPSNTEAYTHLASVQRITGDVAGAEATMKRSRQRNPGPAF